MRYLTALVLVCLAVSSATADESEIAPGLISVQGTAEVKAPADQAELYFSVTGFGSTLRQAVERARVKVAAISQDLLAIGLLKKNLRTSRFYSGENTGGKAFLSSKKDYQAVITVLVSIDNLDLLEPVLFALSESDLETLSDISFSLSDEDTYRKKARELAIAKAKDKASQMAGLMDVSLGRVIQIEEALPPGSPPQLFIRGGRHSPVNVSTYFNNEYGGIGSGGAAGFYAGTIAISAQVGVIFEIGE